MITELNSHQAHSNWLEQELSSKSKQYQHLKHESSDRTIQLQMQLDQTISEKDALTARLTALENIEQKLQENMNNLTTDNFNYKQELSTSKETFDLEIHEHKRIISLQKEQISSWSHRYDDLVKENENLKSTANQGMEVRNKETESEYAVLEQKYTALLQEQADNFEKQRRDSTQYVTVPALLSNAIPVDQGGENTESLSMADLFQQLEETKAALRREQVERKTWQKQFQLVQKDIIEQAPRMIRQREEYDMAVDRLTEYQNRLESAFSEGNDARREATEAKRMVEVLQDDLAERNDELEQLAQQVQALLASRSVSSGSSGSLNDIPTSVQEMQSQNQRLLAENRRLMHTVEELGNKLQSDGLKEQLNNASRELESLQKEREEQETYVLRIVQQRDIYRALLAKQDSTIVGAQTEDLSVVEMARIYSERAKKAEARNEDLEEELKSRQAEHQSVISNNIEMASRLSRYEVHSDELTKSLQKLERDLLTTRSNEARMESDAKYHREHCSRLENALERARNEITQLTSAKNELQRINADMQQALSNSSAEHGSLEGEKRQLESRIRLLETQLETSKSGEKRITEENNQLRSDVGRQGTLVDSIRRIEACLLATKEGENESLRQENESLTKKLADESFKFKIDLDNMSARNIELEDSLAKLETIKESLATERENYKQKLVAAEIETVNHQKGRAPKQPKPSEENNSVVDVPVDMSELERLQSEIGVLRTENEALNESIATARRESEKSLTELQHIVDQMNSEKSDDVDAMKNQVQNLKVRITSKDEIIRDLTDDLSKHTEERAKAMDELKSTILLLETQVQNSERDAESAKATAAGVSHDLEYLRDEIKAANANFEHELALHSQARTALRTATEELDKQVRQRKAADDKLEETTKELNEHIHSLNENLVSKTNEIEMLENRLKDAQNHSTKLYEQVQSLTTTVENNQLSRLSGTDVSETCDVITGDIDQNQKKIETGLREMVKFLQSENNILKIELDAGKRAVKRDKAMSNVLRRSLEETQAELKSLQSGMSAIPHDSVLKTTNDFQAKLQSSEEQLVLLRDSNKLLRDELVKLEHHCSSLVSELDETKLLVAPAKSIQAKLESSISSVRAEKESLETELQSWKDRVKNLVSKFHQIDPDEHKKLESEVEELRIEKESVDAWKKVTEDESNRIRTIAKTLNQKIKEQKSLLESQQKDLEKLTSEKVAWVSTLSSNNAATAKELTELREKLSKTTTNVESKDKELEGANARNDKLREKLREFQTLIRDLRAEVKTLKDQLATAKASSTQQESVKDGSSLPDVKTLKDQLATANASITQQISVKDLPEVKTLKDQLATAKASSIQQESAKDGTSLSASSNQTSSADQTDTEKEVTSSAIYGSIPSIPEGGFRFRPSEKSRSQVTESQAILSLSPKAPSFVPVPTPSVVGDTPDKHAHPSTLEASKTTNVATESSFEGSDPTSHGRTSGVNKEMTMKEVLLAKKMKLALLKRKQETQQISTSEQDGNSPKRVKPDTDADETISSGIKQELPLHQTTQADLVALVLEKYSHKESNEAKVISADLKEVDDSAGKEPENNPIAPLSSQSNAIGLAEEQSDPCQDVLEQSSLFKSLQSTADSTETTSGLGGSFLDMKPPGSSSAPPTFSFGNSSSIQLPLPSLPLTQSPFGAFGPSTSFGSASGNVMVSLPLFGSPAPLQNPVDTQVKQEEESKDE